MSNSVQSRLWRAQINLDDEEMAEAVVEIATTLKHSQMNGIASAKIEVLACE